MRGLVVGLIAVLAAAAVAIAVDKPTGEGDPVRTTLPGGVPVVEGAVFGPGTEIAPGYRVVEGSHLVGRAFPSRNHPEGWLAFVIVTGDADQVLAGYIAQADADGLAVGSDRCGGFHSAPSVEGCEVMMSAEGASLVMRYVRGVVHGRATSLVRIERRESIFEDSRAPGIVRSLRRALPTSWPPLPMTGDTLMPQFLEGEDQIRVAPRTTVVAPAWRIDTKRGCHELAWVLRVADTMHPMDAVAAYTGQSEGSPEDSTPYDEIRPDGTRVIYEPRTAVTVYDLHTTLVDPVEGPSWILLEGCFPSTPIPQ